MSKMTFTQSRATLEETLEFANRVREAGGGNPLDALMPAVPEDPHQCLIAKNLNFNCSVGTTTRGLYTDTVWIMICDSSTLRDNIATALELETLDEPGWDDDPLYAIVLPTEIGRVAETFDEVTTWTSSDEEFHPDPDDHTGEDGEWVETTTLGSWLSPEQVQTFKEFWPYIDESIQETFENATFINEKGEIVL